MIVMISQQTKFPKVNLPIGEYTAYTVKAGVDGYFINYRAHDPRVMATIERSDKPGGFLGLGKKKVITETQYMAEGKMHLDPVLDAEGNALTPKEIACLKKEGGGESTGRIVGGAAGTAVVANTSITSIPVIGWVLGGAMTMIGMNQGAEIGGQMARDFADC
jgi:hypothetical protein